MSDLRDVNFVELCGKTYKLPKSVTVDLDEANSYSDRTDSPYLYLALVILESMRD